MSKRRDGMWRIGLGVLAALAVAGPATPAAASTCGVNVDYVCGIDFQATAGEPYTGWIAEVFPLIDGEAQVDWGDGSTGTADVVGGFVTGSHTYASTGVHTVSVTYNGLTGTAQATVVAPTCDGKTATIFRGSGHPGTTGADGTPMNVTGTSGDDVIVGDSNKDVLRGGDGDDTICGGADNDTLYDNDGADVVFGEAGKDTLYAGRGGDVLSGGAQSDVVSYRLRNTDIAAVLGNTTANGAALENDELTDDIENLTGGAGNDSLTGDAGPNVIRGGSGEDGIDGLAGNDTLSDGPGDDTGVDGGDDNDTFIAGTGGERMSGGPGRDHVTYAARSDGVVAAIGCILICVGEDDIPANVEKLSGSQGNDSLVGSGSTNTIYGEAGADTIHGNGDNDTLLDGPGNDEVHGGAGNDTFYSGAGADTFDGDDGTADLVSYRFRTAPVTVVMGTPGASGTPTPPEGDTIGSTVENLGGGSGGDNLTGNTSRNVIWGNGGDDDINGNDGNDALLGNDGDDTLLDGLGADDLFGGAGDDDFTTQLDSEVDNAYCGDGAADTVLKGEATDTADADCETVTP